MNKALKFVVYLAVGMAVLSLPAFAGAPAPVKVMPEPATLALLATGIGAVVVARRSRNKK